MNPYLMYYLIAINAASLFSMGYDKSLSKTRSRRISERTLFLLAIFGGSPGTLVGMRIFRHKTKHMSFVIGIPAILILQLLACYFLASQLFTALS
jgi:uncharacterized membrane protein YsdA (DUF1294 family)